VLMAGRSEVLDLGRSTRLVTPALRRALELRDRGCCGPGCDRPPEWCDAHHLVHWAQGGETNLDNLVLLCRRHHVLLHEGGWHLARGPDRSIVFTRPAGRSGPELVLAS
jgi:HNH endonuclease